MMVAASCCGDVFQRRDWETFQDRGKDERSRVIVENLIQSSQDLRLGRRLSFQQHNDPKHKAKSEWFPWDVTGEFTEIQQFFRMSMQMHITSSFFIR
jgi:hypothetical protein